MDLEKLEQLIQNEEIAKKIFVDSLEDTLSNLAANGVEMTAEELTAFLKGAQDAQESDELSENALDNVAGGAVNKNSSCYKAGQKAGKALAWVFVVGLKFVSGLW